MSEGMTDVEHVTEMLNNLDKPIGRRDWKAPNGAGAYTGREADHCWLFDEDTGEWRVPNQQARYINWLLTPKWERNPRTLREFAASIGIHPETVYRWRRDERFKKALKKAAEDQNFSTETIQDVINAVVDAAVNKRDMKAAALFLQYVKELQPVTKVIIEDQSLSGLSDQELAKILRAQLTELEGGPVSG